MVRAWNASAYSPCERNRAVAGTTSGCHLQTPRRCRVAFAHWLAYRRSVATPPHRTLLEKLVREGRWTIEETCRAFEKRARELGEQASLSPRQLSRWMSGQVGRPRPVMQRVAEQFWEHGFLALLGPPDAPAHVAERHAAQAAVKPDPWMDANRGTPAAWRHNDNTLGSRPPHPASLDGRAEGDGLERSLQRRILLQQALAAFAFGAIPTLDVIREGLTASMPQRAGRGLDTDEWASVAQDYEHAYYTEAPAGLILDLAADLADLRHDLDAASDPVRRDLSRIASLLAALMAMSLVNLGQFQSARRWWRTARRAADASTDTATRVLVRSHDATHAIYEQRPLTLVLHRAEEAMLLSGASVYPGTAEAIAARAQALALLGRTDEASNAIDQLNQAFDRLQASVTDATTILSGWPARRLWHTNSYVYTQLGDANKATHAQEQATALIPSSAPRPRAQIQLHAARRLVGAGHITDGARHAHAVVAALPAHQRTAMVTGVARQVLDAVPVKERLRPAVRELDELLAPAGHTRIHP